MELLSYAVTLMGLLLFMFGFIYQVIRFGERFDPELSHASMSVGVFMIVMGISLWILR